MPDTAANPVRTDQHQESLQLMLQMATVIRQQADAIADLRQRVTALEGTVAGSIPSTRSCANAAGRPMASPQRGQAGTAPCLVPGDARASRDTAVPVSAPMPQPGVYFCGVVYGGSGYSEEGWAIAVGLTHRDVPVQLVPVDHQSDRNKLIPEAARETLGLLERKFVDIPRSVIFQSSPAPWWNLDWAGRVRVGRTMFETDRLPEVYRTACNAMDEVWVPSQFNLQTFTYGGVDEHRLRIVPGGVDTNVFRPHAPPLEIKPRRSFTFLSVFDWNWRKGYDVLLRAYLREFTPDDDVALILKVHQFTDGSDVEAMICHFIERTAGLPMEKAPTVVLMNGPIPQSEMVRLYATADAFVLPSRGEGYGRPYLEAMACGLPVIATNWGGQLDFLNNQNSFLIESHLAPVPPDVEIQYYRGHCWAEPDVDHLRQLMREAYSHPDEARRKAKHGREDILRKYGWSAVIPRWIHEFQRLLE